MGMSFILLSAALAMTGPVSQGKAGAAAGAGAAAVAAPSSGDPVVEHCLVSLIEEAQIPGREPGVLAALEAKEGLQVKAGTVIGRIDDSEPTAQKRIKLKEHETELEKAPTTSTSVMRLPPRKLPRQHSTSRSRPTTRFAAPFRRSTSTSSGSNGRRLNCKSSRPSWRRKSPA